MTGAAIIAVLLTLAALCFDLALLGWISEKPRIPARWWVWYYKTFKKGGDDEMKPGRIDTPLTEEQRQLAEENHGLIYSFAHKYGLDIEEWYGALAIGFLRRIADWNPERGALSTSVYNKMLSVYGTEVAKCRTIKRTAQIVSLDAEAPGVADVNFHACIPDPRDHMGDTILSADVQRLSPQAQRILLLRVAGYSQREISEIAGISQPHVSRLLNEAAKAIVA